MDAPRESLSSLFGDWLLEASVLVAVFPVVDQLIDVRPFRWSVIGGSTVVAVIFLWAGVYFKQRSQ